MKYFNSPRQMIYKSGLSSTKDYKMNISMSLLMEYLINFENLISHYDYRIRSKEL